MDQNWIGIKTRKIQIILYVKCHTIFSLNTLGFHYYETVKGGWKGMVIKCKVFGYGFGPYKYNLLYIRWKKCKILIHRFMGYDLYLIVHTSNNANRWYELTIVLIFVSRNYR